MGHYFAAVRIDAFREVEEFKAHMDQMLEDLKNAPKAVGQERIYIHGEKEFELAEKYEREGVPLMEEVVEALISSGKAVGVPFDLEPVGRPKKATGNSPKNPTPTGNPPPDRRH